MGFASAGDLAFNGGSFFLASTSNQLVEVDLGNLANTSAVGNFGAANVVGLATGNDGVLYAVAGTTSYEANPSTGALSNPVSFAGQRLGNAFGESFFAEAGANVPAPGSLSLFGAGLAAIGLMRRRKRTVLQGLWPSSSRPNRGEQTVSNAWCYLPALS